VQNATESEASGMEAAQVADAQAPWPDRRPGVRISPQPQTQRDVISRQIIEQLQQDGRRSYVAIAKAVGLSEPAVRQRVQRLIESGAMQIVAVTEPLPLGFRRQTMIGICCNENLQRVADLLARMDAVDYVVLTAGSFDLLAGVVCADNDQLLEILSQVRSMPGVTTAETFVCLKLCKQSNQWGPDEPADRAAQPSD
jgi:Lrp/AsnC family transcriptional regulator, regulator for asnA, asnC and gidA